MSDLPTPEHDCDAVAGRVRAVLDRELPASALADVPTPGCPECGRRVREAAWLLQGIDDLVREQDVSLPCHFTDRVVLATVRDARRRRFHRIAGPSAVAALAAGVLIAVVLTRPDVTRPSDDPFARTPTTPRTGPPDDQPPVRITAQLSDVGDTFAAITRRTADGAVGPAQMFVPVSTEIPEPRLTTPADLADLPAAARSGLSPLTGSAERAFQLFVRDVGAIAGAEPSS